MVSFTRRLSYCVPRPLIFSTPNSRRPRSSYQNGSRPILEAKAGELTSGLDTERQEVLAPLRFVRDLYKGSPGRLAVTFSGGNRRRVDAVQSAAL